MLKVLLPWAADAARNEITVLRLADGEGCARLLRADPARGALLLERLGRPMSELGGRCSRPRTTWPRTADGRNQASLARPGSRQAPVPVRP